MADGLFPSFQPGPRLVDGSEVRKLANRTTIGRFGVAGGTDEVTATPLNAHLNEVTSGSTVSLPAAIPGTVLMIASEPVLTVYASRFNQSTGLPDAIIGAVGSTASLPSAAQGGGSLMSYVCYRAGLWLQTAPGGGGGMGPPGPQGPPGPGISMAPTQPTTPELGDLWFNQGTFRLQIFLGGWVNLGSVV